MNEEKIAIVYGSKFITTTTSQLQGIKLTKTSAIVCVGQYLYELYKGVTVNDLRKIELLFQNGAKDLISHRV